MKKNNIKFIAESAIIAALYAALKLGYFHLFPMVLFNLE